MDTQTLADQNFFTKLGNQAYIIFRGKRARRNIIVILLFLVAIGYTAYAYFGKNTTITYEYATVTKKDLKKTVEGSGTVVSQSELNIQQLSGGQITAVLVKPGDYVKKGQIIAEQDNRQAAIQLAQAKASYEKVINGSTKESLAISQQSVINAKQSYDIIKQQQDTAVANAKRTLLNTSIAAIPVYDSRVQSNIPTISGSYTCSDETEYSIKFVMTDYVYVTNIGQVRISSVPQALGSCGLYISFDQSKDYSNGEWKVSLPNKISSSYSANLNAYNNALQARDQALINAQTSITNAELSYNQTAAGARPEDIASAKASYANAELAYSNTIIRAPFDGQIGSVSASVGQQTSTQTGVATIITKDKIAQVSLNEIDIVNVKLGQPVELVFDAIPNETFMGSIAEINTVGAVTSNVVSFATKISIPNADERIKSGMSVTANIIVEKKENVLTVPSGTIKTEGSGENAKSYVLKKETSNQTSTSTKSYVVVGMTNDVDTEIVEGLAEGEKVVSKTVNGAAATKPAASTFSLFGSGPGGGRTGGTGTSRTGAGR